MYAVIMMMFTMKYVIDICETKSHSKLIRNTIHVTMVTELNVIDDASRY